MFTQEEKKCLKEAKDKIAPLYKIYKKLSAKSLKADIATNKAYALYWEAEITLIKIRNNYTRYL